MTTPNIAVYAGGPLGPAEIATNLSATVQAGWTTIILGLFHIGRPQVSGQNYGDIIFNDMPTIVSGTYVADPSWPGHIAKLKRGGSPISKVYASVGGGSPVVDFATLQHIYAANGNSFAGTALEQNFKLLRTTFPAIDGIDMDCEDNYDSASFVAFCRMLIGIGFDITFCPYASWEMSFWAGALQQVEASNPGAVKWWNLQCYDGGGGNTPKPWADAITAVLPSFDIKGYILGGDWTQDTPKQVFGLLTGRGFAKQPSLGGGFIWNMDGILTGGSTMADYVTAIRKAVP